ncbi:galactose mutarotase [Vibrio splendidus]|uniref:Aldose 1-epimerase n=1 Tax=Vibrio lentus TaxID=136468 RepID=A0A4U2BGS8_9VIBR|nr:galactose-1-epimerase [Vibrio lentus]PHN86891.1 galactose mutarotase [Vibrio splendidus]MCC4818963.1 galactose-1-epimerase [Vibrio lentus]OMO26378.1 galactose-1-epimerase [Vibrio lentus]PMG22398.1 galactose-1-epimerase [Vibrio lentus]PMG73845.1 galactose-1-epimerase [Vibrio lentus]
MTSEQNLHQSMTQTAAYDGQPAQLVTLSNKHGMQVTFMDIGATWLSCILPVKGNQREVLLGVDSMENFQKQASYLGATVGRYANRIANGRFKVDGTGYKLDANQSGNTLHGGSDGFDKRRWQLTAQTPMSVVYSLVSADGDQGFPGLLNVSVSYELTEDNRVSIEYFATTDKATVVNLTNHAYFNLLGANSDHDCLSHIVSINASQYLPTNKVGIPLGNLKSVKSTSFDFNQPMMISERLLGDEQQKAAKGYDHSFLLAENCKRDQCAATVTSPDALVTLKVFSTKPAMQLYTGNWLGGTPNRNGGSYEDYAGIALETQFLPDSPNHPEWKQDSCILRPEQEYRYRTCYQFEFSGDYSN